MGLNAEHSPGQRGSSSEELALLLKKEGQEPHYEGGWVPIDVVNVLPQPRQTFEEIKELARDIADKGLMTPLIVARLNRENCSDYLRVISHLWQTELGIEQLKSYSENGGEFYYMLIAGERRFRAFKYLESEGCGQDHGGGENCFESHFPNRLIEVRLCVDIPPLQAIFLQASENIHMRVPPHEEARFYYNLFTILREVDEKYTLAAFARKVGRSESTIRKAIKFCELPLSIQRSVERGDYPYGKALEIARLIDTGVNEENLGWIVKIAMVQDQTVEEFQDWTMKYIRDLMSGQTMLELFTEAQEEAMKKAMIRRVVARNSIRAIWQRIAYLKNVIGLVKEGKLGEEDSLFSTGSPVRVYLAFIGEMEEALPLLKNHLSKAKAKKAMAILTETRGVLEELKPYLPEGDNDLDPYSKAFNRDTSPRTN